MYTLHTYFLFRNSILFQTTSFNLIIRIYVKVVKKKLLKSFIFILAIEKYGRIISVNNIFNIFKAKIKIN